MQDGGARRVSLDVSSRNDVAAQELILGIGDVAVGNLAGQNILAGGGVNVGVEGDGVAHTLVLNEVVLVEQGGAKARAEAVEDALDLVAQQRERVRARDLRAHDGDNPVGDLKGRSDLVKPPVRGRGGVVRQVGDDTSLGQVCTEVAGLAMTKLTVRDLHKAHGRVLGDDVESGVGRTRIDDEDLVGAVKTLSGQRGEDLVDVLLTVVGQDDNAGVQRRILRINVVRFSNHALESPAMFSRSPRRATSL